MGAMVSMFDLRRAPVPNLVLAGLLLLVSCQQAPVASPPPPPPPSWRVVVWGAEDETDRAATSAIEGELLRRKIAARIVPQAGDVDHVLSVSIRRRVHARPRAKTPSFFETDVTVSEGHDAALTTERTFSTGAPGPAIAASTAADPIATLAQEIGDSLSKK